MLFNKKSSMTLRFLRHFNPELFKPRFFNHELFNPFNPMLDLFEILKEPKIT